MASFYLFFIHPPQKHCNLMLSLTFLCEGMDWFSDSDATTFLNLLDKEVTENQKTNAQFRPFEIIPNFDY